MEVEQVVERVLFVEEFGLRHIEAQLKMRINNTPQIKANHSNNKKQQRQHLN
jgi:hypothetical protein